MKKNNKKAFTLVELLVVIAILAILATVSVVGYSSFTKQAKQSNAEQEMSQLKTILLADWLDGYVGDSSTQRAITKESSGYKVEVEFTKDKYVQLTSKVTLSSTSTDANYYENYYTKSGDTYTVLDSVVTMTDTDTFYGKYYKKTVDNSYEVLTSKVTLSSESSDANYYENYYTKSGDTYTVLDSVVTMTDTDTFFEKYYTHSYESETNTEIVTALKKAFASTDVGSLADKVYFDFGTLSPATSATSKGNVIITTVKYVQGNGYTAKWNLATDAITTSATVDDDKTNKSA